jgi:hypothetical protein
MGQIAIGVMFTTGLFVGMIVLLEVGRSVRRRRHARHGDKVGEGLGAVEAAVFGLMGLLVAFTFSGAASRFDARRELIVEEANAIGTAYLRLDLLKPDARLALQQLLRDYVDARLAVYHAIPDTLAVHTALERTAKLQQEIWGQAVSAVRDAPNPQLAGSLLPAINEMLDISTTRLAATQMHPPAIIFGLLALVALVCALLAGYAMAGGASRSWIHIIGFAAVLSIAVYVIVDLEYPRLGLFKISDFDRMLVDVRASMR